MKFSKLLLMVCLVSIAACNQTPSSHSYTSENLVVQNLTANTYQHISYLITQDFGRVACNGLIVINDDEAVVFDTPVDNNAAAELINWIEDELKCKVTAVVPTHFHVDCLGGLEEFHNRQIPSYGNIKTIELATDNGSIPPQVEFGNHTELQVGNEKVIIDFFGEGHTHDNMVVYFPKELVMFGGCLIKEVGAGKGNLADANVSTWSQTVVSIKDRYGDITAVLPGHGKAGGQELLDYTIELFKNNEDY